MERGEWCSILSTAGVCGVGFRNDSLRSERVDLHVQNSHGSGKWDEVLLARMRDEYSGDRFLLFNEELHHYCVGAERSSAFVPRKWFNQSANDRHIVMECLCRRHIISLAGFTKRIIRINDI